MDPTRRNVGRLKSQYVDLHGIIYTTTDIKSLKHVLVVQLIMNLQANYDLSLYFSDCSRKQQHYF